MGLQSKVRTLLWYLTKPKYYPELFKLIKVKLRGDNKENTSDISTEWCKKNAVSSEKAIHIITGNNYSKEIEEIYKEEYEQAVERQRTCPVKMGGPGGINLLYYLCDFIGATKVIETGVAYGWSSFAILLSLDKRNGHLYSNDMPYAKMNNEDYVGYIIPERLKKNWDLIRLPDQTGIKTAINRAGTIDLCHYDSDKSYAGRLFGYELLWNALRTGGIFISDDIQDNMGFHDFCEKNNLTPVLVHVYGKFVGIVVKK